MKLNEIAMKVIDLAGKVRAYYDAELPKRHPHYPLVESGDQGVSAPPEERELGRMLSALPEETVYQLMLIMYLGRGDLDIGELASYYDELRGTFGDSEHAANQMMKQAPLASYLADGLEELRKNKINPDRMPLKVAARKR